MFANFAAILRKICQEILTSYGSKFANKHFSHCLRQHDTQPEAWLSVSAEQLVLRHCAFWCSRTGQPESENESSVTVQVPRANLFDVAAVTGLMRAINEGGVS